MSAFVPPPPDVASSAGAHALPFHFKTWPDVAPVFTSDKSVNDAAAIRASALALVKYKFEPSAISSVLSFVKIRESTYALTDSADGTLVAVAPDIVSESTIAF